MQTFGKRTIPALSGFLTIAFTAGMLTAMSVPVATEAVAGDAAKPLYERNIVKWQPLKLVSAREFKFLVDPKYFKDGHEAGFKALWGMVKAVAAKDGFQIVEKKENPFKESFATKEYFDTPDFRLRKNGYLIRITTKYKKGKPALPFTVTAKELSPENLYRILGSKLDAAEGYKCKSEIEENISVAADGSLRGYIEIAQKVKLNPQDVGGMNLSDFGKVYPDLLKTSLPADTKLTPKKAFAYTVEPGTLVLDGGVETGIGIEAWSATENGPVCVAEVSFGIETPDYYDMARIQASAERFLQKSLGQGAAEFAFPDAPQWLGSKVRVLLDLPLK